MTKYNHKKIEKKWREKWEKDKIYQPDLSLPAGRQGKDKKPLDKTRGKPFYNLMMFPYPSAEGLHIGNMYAFVHSDCYGRFKRLQGFDVFEPIGLDGFGIHSENYAIKIGEHIKKVSARTEKNFYKQLHMIGNQYDWSRTVETYKPDYYKWTQWLFLKMYEKGLAYRKEASVNWCGCCKTVLSDEQVISGKCERCETETEKKLMEQWFWKITDYAEKLLANLKVIDWSEEVKIGQKNWIGKSEGVLITFNLKPACRTGRSQNSNLKNIEVFTTRPDTLPGCTFLVLSPEHELAGLACRQAGKNLTAINPFNNKEIPIFTDEYVLYDYGTGAIMGVPAYDERDRVFAEKNNLQILEVGPEENKIGKKAVKYKLRDWCISRQRYWGPPIPMVYCEKCASTGSAQAGWVLVPEKDLPVLLPEMEDFLPDGSGKGPLNKIREFVNTKCPKCGGPAKRETDVSDPFVDSCWYYLRYLDAHNDKKPFDKLRVKKWLPVDMYIGGKEHTVLHLLYSRFVSMVLYELGLVPSEEPFEKFRAHGLLIRDGAKISKSKGNIISPDDYIEKFGADTVRMYLMFLGDMRQGGDWRDEGIIGVYRFLNRIYKLQSKVSNLKFQISPELEKLIHQTIKKVTEDLENLKFNTAISQLMILANEMEKEKELLKIDYCKLIILLAPFAPHLAEELWEQLGNKESACSEPVESVFKQKWPKYDPAKIKEDSFELIVQINGKFRGSISASKNLGQSEAEKMVLADEKLAKYLSGQKIKKVIFVKDKLINFVA
ncbi:leucine--tRNA ligase [Patescibacteria group bacterium]|nr:leucine--tRNA ligase [Patescibacteria group bacterium]